MEFIAEKGKPSHHELLMLEDPPSAVDGLICFLFVGDLMKLKDVLKIHGLRSMDL